MKKGVCGDHTRSFLFSTKPAIQNFNIQQGVFLAKIKDQQSMYFFHLQSFHEFLGYFPWFVASKSVRIEVFHIYYQWCSLRLL